MFYTPRFSYGTSETAIWDCPGGTTSVQSGGERRVGTRGVLPGYGDGWVPGRGNTGTQPSCSGRGPRTAKRAPEALQGLEWVVLGARASVQAWYHPAGPVGSLRAPPCTSPSLLGNAASWPIRARLRSYSSKVSQNRVVSPKYVEKACHSPCFQNGSQSRLLKFPDFYFP